MKLILLIVALASACGAQAKIDVSVDGDRVAVDITDERLVTVLRSVSRDLDLNPPDTSRVDPREIVDLSARGKIEVVFERLLRNYNHIFKYDQAGELTGVTILGRKSADTGPYDTSTLPDAPPDVEESQPAPEQEPEQEE